MLTISDKLTCPFCGARFHLHEATAVTEALALAQNANRFGSLWPSVLAYAESFQQPGGRGLSVARLMVIVNDVAAMFTDQGFVYGRQTQRIDRDVLIAALKEVGQVGKTGFKNHNYLKVVAIDMQAKVARQRGAEQEKKLRQKEQQLMAGRRKGVAPQGGVIAGARCASTPALTPSKPGEAKPQTDRCILPPSQRKSNNVDQIGAIIDQLNLKPQKEETGDAVR